MKNLYLILSSLLLVWTSCGSSDSTDAKRKQLADYKNELAALQLKIDELERELKPLEDAFIVKIGVDTLQLSSFGSRFSFQASVASDKNVWVSSEVPGIVSTLHVKEGQRVSQGQVLLSMDASTIQSQLEEVEVALELAQTLFEKQARLSSLNIGTQVQYLEAKNRFEALTKQKQSIRLQLAKYTLRAPFDGTVDAINAQVGALANPGTPQVRVVDNSDLKIVAQVPETYLGIIETGDSVNVHFPGVKLSLTLPVASVGKVINPDNRTFDLILKPHSHQELLKPNLLAMITATEFSADSVITVPTQILKRDTHNNPYVFVAQKSPDGFIAVKQSVTVDRYGTDVSLISEGLNVGDLIVVKGYNSLDDQDKVLIIN